MKKQLSAAIAAGGLAVTLLPGTAQALQNDSQSPRTTTQQATTKGTTPPVKCKVRAKIAIIPKSGRVGARVKVKCPSNTVKPVTAIHNRITLYRNGDKVGSQVIHGKRSTSNLQSAPMSGTKCQKWRVNSKTLAQDVNGTIRFAHDGDKSAKKCP